MRRRRMRSAIGSCGSIRDEWSSLQADRGSVNSAPSSSKWRTARSQRLRGLSAQLGDPFVETNATETRGDARPQPRGAPQLLIHIVQPKLFLYDTASKSRS